MDISFKTKKVQKECNDSKLLQRNYGERQARLIRQRLDELRAAEKLADISRLPPPRCHELVGNRAGQLSVDLVFPYRLIFIPANDPIPQIVTGGLDWSNVTAVEIVGVENTHE